MIHAYGVRAASLATSALMLGLLLFAAMSLTTTIRAFIDVAPPPVEAVVTPPSPTSPPPTAVVHPTPPKRAEITDAVLPPPDIPPAGPIEPIGFSQLFPPGPVLIERPRWAVKPDNLGVYFPARALERGVEGEVSLDCLVTTVGALQCVILSETPRNWGFGAAALRIASDHTMIPALRDGIPAEGRYVMNVPFRLAR